MARLPLVQRDFRAGTEQLVYQQSRLGHVILLPRPGARCKRSVLTGALERRCIPPVRVEGKMAANTLLISAGDVIEVQLTSETVVIEGADRRHVEPGHITNRMRLFVRETDGSERKYDFEDTELGVRETQRVAIVRGALKRAPEPMNLLLFNLSSGEKDAFESGLAVYLGRKPFFGPLWKAAVLALGVALIFWFVSNFIERNGQGGLMSVMLAVMFAFLTYPVFWWLARTWDRITERWRYRAARKRFIAEMTGRVQSYAPGAEPAEAPPAPPASSPAVTDPSAQPT
jgi:translation initiation factor IF-1